MSEKILKNINLTWENFFKKERKKEYFRLLINNINKLYEEKKCFPKYEDIFSIFSLVSQNNIKVVILGQDPYPSKDYADGIAFSSKSSKRPQSLNNIFKELKSDIGIHRELNCLKSWVKQGVFLINTVWTVTEKSPGSHKGIGWENFTINLLKCINSNEDLIYVLWGNKAKSFRKYIPKKHTIIESAHPSPLSYRLFVGSKPFSKVNSILKSRGLKEIKWD